MLCIKCKKNPIAYKKQQLCMSCYGKWYRNNRTARPVGKGFSLPSIKKYQSMAELEFVKNFFDHKNWLYEPATFKFNGTHYTPDFYDGERGCFIEVIGTRQAYHLNKAKYALFRKAFPLIKFEIRQSDGSLLGETEGRRQWTVVSNQLLALLDGPDHKDIEYQEALRQMAAGNRKLMDDYLRRGGMQRQSTVCLTGEESRTAADR